MLLIDLDPQANITTWLGIKDAELLETVYPVATEARGLPVPREVFGLHVIPSRVDLALAEAIMPGRIGAELFLRRALTAVDGTYDVVLIDSSPSVGKLAALVRMLVNPALRGSPAYAVEFGVHRWGNTARAALPRLACS